MSSLEVVPSGSGSEPNRNRMREIRFPSVPDAGKTGSEVVPSGTEREPVRQQQGRNPQKINGFSLWIKWFRVVPSVPERETPEMVPDALGLGNQSTPPCQVFASLEKS
jgi:hypothetical protein